MPHDRALLLDELRDAVIRQIAGGYSVSRAVAEERRVLFHPITRAT